MSALDEVTRRLEAGESGLDAALLFARKENWISYATYRRAQRMADVGALESAALVLVPEGWFWQVKRGFGYEAVVWSVEREGFWAGASQDAPALALCIAALKARRAGG